jgi:isopentenyl-diphosphate delta-isomerase
MSATALDTNQTSKRKQDHIELAFLSQTLESDNRFYYEPMLSAHPDENSIPEKHISGKTLKLPLWVSSMTGGTAAAAKINRNLAKACAEFGMGFGLGSCRIILKDKSYFDDFNVRPYLGDAVPLYANLGIAQIEELLKEGRKDAIKDLVTQLDADGLIVHVNPLQEWLQPEGDKITAKPIDTIKELLNLLDIKIIVKEVGQGFGPKSMKALMSLPLEAIEFGAHGGTNFSTLELHRQSELFKEQMQPISKIGHSAIEMIQFSNQIADELGADLKCKNLIASGGIKTFLDGYYLIQTSKLNTIYAQASAFLKHATEEYSDLKAYCELQKKGLETCFQYLNINTHR